MDEELARSMSKHCEYVTEIIGNLAARVEELERKLSFFESVCTRIPLGGIPEEETVGT